MYTQTTICGIVAFIAQLYCILYVCILQAQSSALCNTILDVMSSIYHQDSANYFILEPQHTLSQFAEKIHLKSPDVQVNVDKSV